jgi:hypothetical protein
MQMGSVERAERMVGDRLLRRAATYGNVFRSSLTLVALGAAVFGGSTTVAAEFTGMEPVAVRDAIGGGIHAYHAGDYDRAYDALTNAIEAGTDDPRSYYFRGLAALKLGRTSEAEADFITGADREVSTGSIRRVSQSLERVQGYDRLKLERFRARARLVGLQRDQEMYGRRYSAIEDASTEVRRRRRPEGDRSDLVVPREIPDVNALPPAGTVEEVPAPAARKASPAEPSDTFEDEPAVEADEPFGARDSEDMPESSLDERAVQDELTSAEDEDTQGERAVQSEVEAVEGR